MLILMLNFGVLNEKCFMIKKLKNNLLVLKLFKILPFCFTDQAGWLAVGRRLLGGWLAAGWQLAGDWLAAGWLVVDADFNVIFWGLRKQFS